MTEIEAAEMAEGKQFRRQFGQAEIGQVEGAGLLGRLVFDALAGDGGSVEALGHGGLLAWTAVADKAGWLGGCLGSAGWAMRDQDVDARDRPWHDGGLGGWLRAGLLSLGTHGEGNLATNGHELLRGDA